jgi:uncharacterized membrane protein YgdD (TMEM256/DUF423 family)
MPTRWAYVNGVFYHFIHAIGLLVVSILPSRRRRSWECASAAGWIVLFSGSPYLPPVRRIRERGAVNSLKGGICLFCLLGCLGYIWCFRKGHRGWHGNSWSSFTRTDTDLHESALRRQGSCAPPIWRTISRELSPNRVHGNHVASARLISLRKAKRWWDPPMGDKLYNTC